MTFSEAVAACRRQAREDAGNPLVAPGNRSLLLAGPRPAGKAALVLHGFSAGPRECEDLARLLRRRGFAVWAPRLAGQAAGRAAFEATRHTAWVEAGRTALDCAASLGRELVVVGHSCGGALAAALVAERPGRVARLALAAPCFRTVDRAAPLAVFPPARWLRPVIRWKPRNEEEARHWIHEYGSVAVAQLVRMGAAGQRAALRLRLPLLMIQAAGDPVVDCRHNQRLFTRIPSGDKRLEIYPGAEHNVLHRFNPLQARALGRIADFLEGRP